MDPRNYLREFICSEIKVQDHSNPLYVGLQGHIEDETARTFRVRSGKKLRVIPKITGKFTIKSSKFTITVRGSSIMMRPEERLKNLRKIIKHENRGVNYN